MIFSLNSVCEVELGETFVGVALLRQIHIFVCVRFLVLFSTLLFFAFVDSAICPLPQTKGVARYT